MRVLTLIALLAVIAVAGYYISQTTDIWSLFQRFPGPESKQSPPNQQHEVSISIISAPSSVVEGKIFTVGWRVKGPPGSSTTDTRIYYDTVSHPGTFRPGFSPEKSGYTMASPSQIGSIPADFEITLIAPMEANQTFFRAYCLVNGIGYWSNEEFVAIEESTEPLLV